MVVHILLHVPAVPYHIPVWFRCVVGELYLAAADTIKQRFSIAICYSRSTCWVHCASPSSILIYSALLLIVHSGSLSYIVEQSACPRGISIIAVVLCLKQYITEFYTYSTNFFTAIFLTPPNTFAAYFFCPKIQRRHQPRLSRFAGHQLYMVGQDQNIFFSFTKSIS